MPHNLNWLGRDIPSGINLLDRNFNPPIPKFLIAFCGDGGGDEFCFDTRESDGSGEYPIVLWQHEIHDEHSANFERVSPDLGTFLLSFL